jgi:hypothetical protein
LFIFFAFFVCLFRVVFVSFFHFAVFPLSGVVCLPLSFCRLCFPRLACPGPYLSACLLFTSHHLLPARFDHLTHVPSPNQSRLRTRNCD